MKRWLRIPSKRYHRRAVKQCHTCDRHLFGPEPSCPFCGAAQATTCARRGSTAIATVTLVLGLCMTACGPTTEPEQTEGSTSIADSGTTTTSPSTGVGPTTDDGPMTTIASSSSGVDSTDDNPGSFYAIRPDSNPLEECDVFAQDCPVGDKCMPWANDGGGTWNAAHCVPVADSPGQPGDPCTVEGGPTSGFDDCDLGVMCFHVDPATNEGVCVAMCTGTPAAPMCEEAQQTCVTGGGGVVALCLDTCDPLASMCDAGEGCYPNPSGAEFLCLPTATAGVYGDDCSGVDDCDTGHVCLAGAAFPDCAGGGCCTEYCDVTAPEACPEAMLGATCQPWFGPGMAPPGLENVGVCALPP